MKNSSPHKTPAVTPFVIGSILAISSPMIAAAILNDQSFCQNIRSWLSQSIVHMTYLDVVLVGVSWVVLVSIALTVVVNIIKKS